MAREMKDSGVQWLGDVPSTWRIVRSKSLFRQRSSKGSESGELLAATQTRGMYPQRLLEGVVRLKEGTDLQQLKTVCVGDYVISLRSFQGGFEMSQYEGVCSPAYQVFYPYQDVDRDYYRYLFKSPRFIAAMDSLTVGIREGKNIRYQDFANSCVPVPPIDEQRRIADYLDAKCAEIDRAIEAAERSIEEYEELRRSHITEMVRHRASWHKTRLSHVCTRIFDGPFGSNLKSNDYVDEGVFVVRLENLRYLWFNKEKQSFVTQEKYETISAHTVYPGDLIMSTFIVDCVKVCEMPEVVERAVNKADCIGIRPKDSSDVSWIKYCLASMDTFDYLSGLIHGTTRPRVNSTQIRSIPIFMPDRDTREKIVALLDEANSAIDSIVAAKQSIIDDLKAYKQSLVYEVVTGKREV